VSWHSADGSSKRPFSLGVMDCDTAHEQITLFLYGELPDESYHALEGHLAGCEACRQELEVARALAGAMAILPVQEPSPNLLAQTRLRLDEALDRMPRTSWLQRVRQSMLTDFSLLRTAPVAAAALLFAGMGLGGYAGFRSAQPSSQPVLPNPDAPITIAGVSGVSQRPESGLVQVEYSRVVPEVAIGPADDPAIRQLLAAGVRSPLAQGVQTSSLALLTGTCGRGPDCGRDPGLRDALMVGLRYDRNPQVRQQALAGLEPFLTEDTHVRDAVLETVLEDSDSEVRSKAISMLEAVNADSSVQQVLHTVAAQDDNPGIRRISAAVLEQRPQTQ
jgi:HEAT repeats/Putative zinc-finger